MATPYYRGFQLGLLPERRMNWKTLALSYGMEAVFILILVNLGLLFPDKLQVNSKYHVTELIPLPGVEPKPLPVKKPAVVQHAKLLPAAPIEHPHMIVPREVRAPKPVEPEPEAPKVAMNQFKAPEIKMAAGGARPQLIHTGDFSTGSSATPTVNAPASKVQTGGFGDPNGVKGEGKPGAKLVIASAGFSSELPQGPGYGNGTGGSRGIKGTVASAGFGNGVAIGGNGDGRSNGRGSGVATGGFGQQEVSQNTGKSHQVDSGPPTTQVEILFKPNPVYTEEARQLKLEGEVLLEVMFEANGQLHVNRVVRGLGHGLDETAIAAANKMRFKPALRNGQPVDSTAIVHVVFQLAY